MTDPWFLPKISMKNSIPKDCHCSLCGYTGLLGLRAAVSQCGPCQLREAGAVLVAHILDKLLSERWTWLCTALIQLTYCNTLPRNTVTKRENQIKLWQNVTTPVYFGKIILKMNRSTLFTYTCFCLCVCMCDTYMTGACKIRGRYQISWNHCYAWLQAAMPLRCWGLNSDPLQGSS